MERLKGNADLIGGDLALLSYLLDMALLEARSIAKLENQRLGS